VLYDRTGAMPAPVKHLQAPGSNLGPFFWPVSVDRQRRSEIIRAQLAPIVGPSLQRPFIGRDREPATADAVDCELGRCLFHMRERKLRCDANRRSLFIQGCSRNISGTGPQSSLSCGITCCAPIGAAARSSQEGGIMCIHFIGVLVTSLVVALGSLLPLPAHAQIHTAQPARRGASAFRPSKPVGGPSFEPLNASRLMPF